MTSSAANPAKPPTHDVTALVAAVARNAEAGGLRKFLELYRWKVLADYMHPATHVRGELIIGQGETDRKVYFVESGDLKVDMHTDKGIVHLAIVGPGSVVGEASFFSHLPRIAAVSAYSDCKIWILPAENFERLSHANANVALAVSMALGTILATRMQDMSKRVSAV